MAFETITFPFPAADPFVLHASDGWYYLYCTQEGGGGAFPVRRSRDLHSWEERGLALDASTAKWGENRFWAPECYEIGGKYYLFYSAHWKDNPTNAEENFRIGVAVSDAPDGPFADMSDQPLFDPGYPIIDANLYQENGRFYLTYSRCCYEHSINGLEESWIYGVELKQDFTGVIGEPVLLLKPEQEWEGRSAAQTGRRWNEGSFLMKHGDIYYMTYSGNFFGGPDYAVGYATASQPLGPYQKAQENPILERHAHVTGTGHSCMLHDGENRLLICYHGRTEQTGGDRIGFISEAAFTDEGKLKILI